MPAQAIIERSVANGPFVLRFVVDGDVQTALTGIANLGAALDAAKPLAQSLPGQVKRVFMSIDSS